MSTISLRLPESLHETARALAEKEEISLDQLITSALAEKVSALLADDYVEARARRGDRERFLQAMAKVTNGEPEEADRL